MTTHKPAGPAVEELEEGWGYVWVRYCTCGRRFVSRQDWQHVPALYDHLALVPANEETE